MLSGMYVVWWVVREGRPGACGISIAIITTRSSCIAAGASNQERREGWRGKAPKGVKKATNTGKDVGYFVVSFCFLGWSCLSALVIGRSSRSSRSSRKRRGGGKAFVHVLLHELQLLQRLL